MKLKTDGLSPAPTRLGIDQMQKGTSHSCPATVKRTIPYQLVECYSATSSNHTNTAKHIKEVGSTVRSICIFPASSCRIYASKSERIWSVILEAIFHRPNLSTPVFFRSGNLFSGLINGI